MTAEHHNPGVKRDAASIWIEDVTQASCKVCLRELQNYAGSHKDIHVVSISLYSFRFNSTIDVKLLVTVYWFCLTCVLNRFTVIDVTS